jgi:hypothetical protein
VLGCSAPANDPSSGNRLPRGWPQTISQPDHPIFFVMVRDGAHHA